MSALPIHQPSATEPSHTVQAGARRNVRLVGTVATFAIVAVVYALCARELCGIRALYVSDQIARYVMIRDWLATGDLVHIRNANADFDPVGRIQPLGVIGPEHPVQGCVVHVAGSLATVYPPAFPYLSGLVYRAFGFAGLFVLPLIAGIGALFITYLTAARLGLQSARYLPIVMGLCTPLAGYSASFWDHSIHMLLTAGIALAMLRCIRQGRTRAAVLAGALAGGGLWFHELFVVVWTASLLACLIVLRGPARRSAGLGLLLGFGLALGTWMACNAWWYGAPLSPHLSGLRNLAGARYAPTDPVLHRTLAAAKMQLLGSRAWTRADAIFLGGVLAFFVASRMRGLTGWLVPAAWTVISALAVGWATTDTVPAGLLEATPLLLGAIAPLGLSRRRATRNPAGLASDAFWRWMVVTCSLFALVVLTSPQTPGGTPGSRYLLTILPMLALLAARGLEQCFAGLSSYRRLVASCGLGMLVVASATAQAAVVQSMRKATLRRQQVAAAVLASHAQAAVAPGDPEIGAVLAGFAPSIPGYLVRDASESVIFCSTLQRRQVDRFVSVGYSIGFTLATARIAADVMHGPRPLLPVATTDASGIELIHFVRQSRPLTAGERARAVDVLAQRAPMFRKDIADICGVGETR